MYSLCMLFHILPFILVELGGVPWPRGPVAELQMVGRFERRAQGRAKGRFGQRNERVQMPHYSELLEDMS